MIRPRGMPLWLKLFIFAALMLLPTVSVLVISLHNSLGFLADVAINADVEQALGSNVETLGKLKKLLPLRESEALKETFQKHFETYQAYSQLKNVKNELVAEFYLHAMIVGSLALILSLLIAAQLARSILRLFNQYAQEMLTREHQQSILQGLENWQDVSQSVIHELKGSLTPIKLFASQTMSDAMDASMKAEASLVINKEVRKMEVLIDDLTGFARLPKPKLSDDDLIDTLSYLVKNFRLDGLAVTLDTQNLEHTAPIVPHDAAMIQRLIFNLMKNCKEANPQLVGLTMTITAQLTEGALNLHICDNGDGIPAQRLSAVFAPRVSAKPTSAPLSPVQRLPTNLGLGLTISKKIALDHHGDLCAVPSASGAHFVLVLPCKNQSKVSWVEV